MITRFYVTRTAGVHPIRPLNTHAEPIDGDATATVRPYLTAQDHADQAMDDTAPCWVPETPAGRTS